LITWSERILEATLAELDRQVRHLARCDVTVQSLRSFGAVILVRDENEACSIANAIAPEHLHIAIDHGERLLPRLQLAGATFVGNYSPVSLGDYVAGPSHVLPTGGTARWASGLTANDFLRSGSVISYSRQALFEAASDVQIMADKEGLTAHRASIDMRLARGQPRGPAA
jgi:histidinol dehydrogenase